MSEPALALYKFEGCPFCERVRAAIDDLGLEVEERDVHRSPERARELQEAVGRATVPVLRVATADGSGRWLPESGDIVDFLYAEYGQGRRPSLLASAVPLRVALVAAVGLLLGAGFAPEPWRWWLLAGGLLAFGFRNSLPLLLRRLAR